MSAVIILHPALPRLQPMGFVVRVLARAGYSVSNVRKPTHAYEARVEAPTLTNVVHITGNPFGRPRAQDYFDFGNRPQ